MQHNDEVEMEIFRSGHYGQKGSYSMDDLQAMADDYRPDLLEAPLTFDHAQTGPAFGWVSKLRRENDRLIAVLKGVPDSVRELVRAGTYKRRSVELFRKLPNTGRPYLRAVSLLGAATPEVKGMREVCFAASTDSCRVEMCDEDSRIDMMASLEKDIQELNKRVDLYKVELMFAELRADGFHVNERDAQAISQFATAGASEDRQVQFDDSTSQPALDWLGQFLRQNLLRTPLGEAAPSGNGRPASSTQHEQFSERTDPKSLALHRTALQLQADTPNLPYREALRQASSRA